MDEKPALWPWIRRTLDLPEGPPKALPVAREKIRLPSPVLREGFVSELRKALKPDQISIEEEQRLLHSYGKSFPDLFLVRRGSVRRAPDLVVFPESHTEVETLVRLAAEHGVVLVPFGGGTNIAGGVNPQATDRMVVSLDLGRMNRLLSLDPHSRTAVIEAGALGPKLESDLKARGHSLGHCPDSFEYSSLGGWIATRSAGMQSDAYGRIEDMVVALKMVTPSGTLATRPVPASSAGPDLNRVMAGSEGVLGVITECTMRVHPFPKAKDYRGILFKSFSEGLEAVYESVHSDTPPSMLRLQDEEETDLAFHMKSPKGGLEGWVQGLVKRYLVAAGYGRPALLVVGIEGDPGHVRRVRSKMKAVFKRHGGFDLGAGVGETWAKDKFNLPYLRDVVMDHAVMVDVSETSTLWSNILELHRRVREGVKAKYAAEGTPGFLGCHLSHSYPTGACLYFTYACRQRPGSELEQYYSYKKLFTDLFMDSGAALTHHHAVGTEHRPWLEREVSRTGVKALKGLKTALDPRDVMNPGKLIPSEDPFSGWVQPAPPVDGADHRKEPVAEKAGAQHKSPV